jgi:hypothetical protein
MLEWVMKAALIVPKDGALAGGKHYPNPLDQPQNEPCKKKLSLCKYIFVCLLFFYFQYRMRF